MVFGSQVCLVLMLSVLVWCKEHIHKQGPNVPHSEDGEHNEEFDHQAVLGSEALDNEFQDLPPEEARKRLKAIVMKHDLNSDGIITKEEMSKWITDSYQKLDRIEAKEKFEEEDTDGDGKLTWPEYLNKIHSFTSDDVQKMRITLDNERDKTEDGREAGETLKMVDDDEKFFKAADVNKDGSLDLDEYMAFFLPPNYPHMHDVEMDRYMSDTDTDKDGKISMQEFIPEEQASDRDSRITAQENFDEFDQDKDGLLTREEVKGWVLPSLENQVDEEVAHLISIADTDENEQLTMDEILDKTHEFTGSSITDYGNLLNHEEL